MISFRNDYSEGAHPRVLDAIARCNLDPASGYSTDPRCAAAKDIIRADPCGQVRLQQHRYQPQEQSRGGQQQGIFKDLTA